MKPCVSYSTLGVVLAGFGFSKPHGALALFAILTAAAGFGLVGVAYSFGWPGVLGKARSGKLLGTSYLIFWPYHLVNHASLLLARWLSPKSERMHEVLPGLWQGGCLWPWDAEVARERGFRGVLDLTSEFGEVSFLRRGLAYCCIPLLDRTGPTPAQLEAGVEFISQRLPEGPVYIHCAMGYGRSSVFTIAYLLKSGKCGSVSEALSLVQEKRRHARLNAPQQRALERWNYERGNL